MIVWICDKCGCQVKDKKPKICPLCRRSDAKFSKKEVSNPTKDDKEFSKKYEEVIKELKKYTKGCEPLDDKYNTEE